MRILINLLVSLALCIGVVAFVTWGEYHINVWEWEPFFRGMLIFFLILTASMIDALIPPSYSPQPEVYGDWAEVSYDDDKKENP